jgi:mycofactocin precursor
MAVTTTSPDTVTEEVEASGQAGDVVVLVEEDLLVEDVSIDGMCGVY